eukprot:365961-Chlamydomonas_euryale.AAC.6
MAALRPLQDSVRTNASPSVPSPTHRCTWRGRGLPKAEAMDAGHASTCMPVPCTHARTLIAWCAPYRISSHRACTPVASCLNRAAIPQAASPPILSRRRARLDMGVALTCVGRACGRGCACYGEPATLPVHPAGTCVEAPNCVPRQRRPDAASRPSKS